MSTGKFKWLYIKACRPQSAEFAEFIKRHGKLHAMGDNCRINFAANITDPEYVSLGNNVGLSQCNLFGHDGVVAMLNQAYNMKADSVGKIVIGNNVYVGHGAIILPGVHIGSNVIVAAGAVVNRNLPDGVIVAGTPAKVIGNTAEYAQRLKERTKTLPWRHLIENRKSAFDPRVEKELVSIRVKHFYPDAKIG